MELMKDFINDKMKVLLAIKEHLIDVEGVSSCPLNQDELASIVGCSKVKVNNLLKELVNDGYVEVPKKGRYMLTKLAYQVINKME